MKQAVLAGAAALALVLPCGEPRGPVPGLQEAHARAWHAWRALAEWTLTVPAPEQETWWTATARSQWLAPLEEATEALAAVDVPPHCATGTRELVAGYRMISYGVRESLTALERRDWARYDLARSYVVHHDAVRVVDRAEWWLLGAGCIQERVVQWEPVHHLYLRLGIQVWP